MLLWIIGYGVGYIKDRLEPAIETMREYIKTL